MTPNKKAVITRVKIEALGSPLKAYLYQIEPTSQSNATSWKLFWTKTSGRCFKPCLSYLFYFCNKTLTKTTNKSKYLFGAYSSRG